MRVPSQRRQRARLRRAAWRGEQRFRHRHRDGLAASPASAPSRCEEEGACAADGECAWAAGEQGGEAAAAAVIDGGGEGGVDEPPCAVRRGIGASAVVGGELEPKPEPRSPLAPIPYPAPNLACALQASGTAPPRGRSGGGAWAVGALGRPALLARERSGARVCAPPTLNPSPYRLIAPMAGWACALVNDSMSDAHA